MQFGPKLKQLRDQAGLSQAKLAEHTGISFGSIQGFEQGLRFPADRQCVLNLAAACKANKEKVGELLAAFTHDQFARRVQADVPASKAERIKAILLEPETELLAAA